MEKGERLLTPIPRQEREGNKDNAYCVFLADEDQTRAPYFG